MGLLQQTHWMEPRVLSKPGNPCASPDRKNTALKPGHQLEYKYLCTAPQPPTDGGGKQMGKNVPAEVTLAGGGEDKRRFTPRLSSAPTILLP